jgi:(5-formylfuran-3-yl)methyl phosphate synthase
VSVPNHLKLLVSYQNASEFEATQGFLPDWIDLKNPDQGSLGCPTPQTAETFLRTARSLSKRGATPISIAIGELKDRSWLGCEEIIARFDFAKIGLAQCRLVPTWQKEVLELQASLDLPNRLILCYFADANLADSPDWEQVLEASQRIGATYVLVDTFDKHAGRLWDWCSEDQLLMMKTSAQEVGIQLALAGSMQLDELPRVIRLGVSVVGFRGAVCKFGSRVQTLCRDRLSKASEAIRCLMSLST